MTGVGVTVACSGRTSEEEAFEARHIVTARDVMVSRPKSLPVDAAVGDARAVLADDHVHMVLLTDGATLCGTLLRADLPAGLSGREPAVAWAVMRGRTVPPDTPAELVETLLIRHRMRRLAVVDADRTLLDLVCLKRSWSGFCSDADVASRGLAVTENPTTDSPTMENPHGLHFSERPR